MLDVVSLRRVPCRVPWEEPMARNSSRRDRGDGALYQEVKSGRWVGRVVIDGQRRKVTATTKTEAARKLRDLRRNVDAGLPVTPGNLTVSDVLTQWMTKAVPNRS